MYGLAFVVSAIVAVQASAEAQDNAYYVYQPEITPHEYSTQRYYTYEQPRYIEQAYEPVYAPHEPTHERYIEPVYAPHEPTHERYIEVPEYRHIEPEVRYVQVEPAHHETPVHHEVRHEPIHHEAVHVPVHHETVHQPVHHETVHQPVVHEKIEDHHSRYVEVPEELYERYMAGHIVQDQVHHEVNTHEPRLVHHDVLTHHEQVGHHDVVSHQVVHHEAPDYTVHYAPGYYVDGHQTQHFDSTKGAAGVHHEIKSNSEVTEGVMHDAPHHETIVHHEIVHEPVVHEVVHHVVEHIQPVVHEEVVHHDHDDDFNVEHMDRHHHTDHHEDVHHDLPVDDHHHEPEHIAEHHDTDLHDTHHEMEHGHHDTHYDSEHFYDSPYHHGGLHGYYDDPMAHEGGHSYYEDEEHVPHFTHHSEEPLTHTEEYYYGAPIHHYHHDYHHTAVSHSCWKKASGRTAGEPLSDCAEGKEKDGALCFDQCKDGFSGVGPVCWQNCPHDSGFRDDGAYCYKPDAYGRGAGEVHQCGPSCEKWGNFWYPKCHQGFHNVGCCVCSPDCPAGMIDIGISCAKGTYSRGAGSPLICHEDQVQSGALCYPPCEHKANGIGPICWGQCPTGTRECGPLCLGADEICSEYIANEAKIAYQLVEDAAEHTPAGTVIDMAHIGSEITFPNCPNW